MTANLAFAGAFQSFLPILLPAYVLSVGGTPTDVGVAMSFAGLFALLGPTIGGFAARYAAYRWLLAGGVLAMAGGFAILALSKGDSFMIVLAIGVMGIGAAAVLVVSPAFIVGAGLSKDMQAKQLTSYSILGDVGKILGGGLLGALAAANLSYDARFWICGGCIAALAVFVWLTSAKATSRLLRASSVEHAPAQQPAGPVSLKSLLVSLFGLLLFAQLLVTMSGQFVSSQYSNIFTNVFSLSEEQISSMVSASGFVGIGLYVVAGIWMTHADSTLVWAVGNGLRGLGGLVLAVLGAVGGVPYVAILGAYILFESTAAFTRIAQAASAVAFAPAAAAIATGWLAAGQALGQSGASLGAGLLADITGSFEVLLWVAGALGIASATIGLLVLVPAARRRTSARSDVRTAKLEAAGRTDFSP